MNDHDGDTGKALRKTRRRDPAGWNEYGVEEFNLQTTAVTRPQHRLGPILWRDPPVRWRT
jgi:hypothetical protein